MMLRVQKGFRGLSGRFLVRGFASSLLEGWEQLLFIPDSRSMGGWFCMDEPETEARFDTLMQVSMTGEP
jgi:hypothetical protein